MSPRSSFPNPAFSFSYYSQYLIYNFFFLVQEKTKVVSIDGYSDVGQSDNSLLCATVKQPISVAIDGSSWDFQLYTGVSVI